MFRFSRLIMAGVVTAFAVWCVVSLRADLVQVSISTLLRSWNLLLLAVILTVLNYALRVTRWRWYLALLGHSTPVGFTALTYLAGFAFTLSPGKLGELIRARYYTAVGVPLCDVMGAFWTERLVDLVALLILTIMSFQKFPGHHGLVQVAGIIIAVGASLIVLLPLRTVTRFLGSPRFPTIVARGAARMLTSFEVARSLLTPLPIVGGLLLALPAWGFEGLGLGILGSIFSPVHNDAPTTVGIYAVAVLVGAVSFLPGGVGSTETVMTALLVSKGYFLAPALLTTLACRITTLWLGVGLGWVAVAMLRYGYQYERPVWPNEL